MQSFALQNLKWQVLRCPIQMPCHLYLVKRLSELVATQSQRGSAMWPPRHGRRSSALRK